MRLLYAGHTYLIGENQKKLFSLSCEPSVEVAAVVPHVWREPILQEIRPHVDSSAPFKMYPTRVLFAGNEMRHMYLSIDLNLRAFKPDVIVVENGAGALAYTQFLLYRKLFAPQAKAIFFTWWNLPYRARQPFRAIEQFNLLNSDAAIAGNRDAEVVLRQQGFSGPIMVLPQLGVDVDLFAIRDVYEMRRSFGFGKYVIGFVGRLVPEKGIRVLLRALEEFDGDFDLLLVGRGPLETEIQQWGSVLPSGQRVHLHPSVPHSQIADLMNTMDVFVLPSLTKSFWKEQFGHALIEAMACQVAVVGSGSAEIPSVIADAGLVVPEGDPDALRRVLQRLAMDHDLRHDLAARGRKRVLEKYTHAEIAQKTLEFLRNLVSGGLRGS